MRVITGRAGQNGGGGLWPCSAYGGQVVRGMWGSGEVTTMASVSSQWGGRLGPRGEGWWCEVCPRSIQVAGTGLRFRVVGVGSWGA